MSSDLRPEAQEVVDDVKAIIAPFKERIEALERRCRDLEQRSCELEGEVERLSKAHDHLLQQNTRERAACHKQLHRAERLRVALTKAHNDLDISPLTDKEREAVVAEISAIIHGDDKQ